MLIKKCLTDGTLLSNDRELILLSVWILSWWEWMLDPVEEVNSAANSEYNVDDPGNKQGVGDLALGSWFKVANISLLALVEKKSQNSEEEKCPNTDDNPAYRAADTAAAADTFRNSH